jgi:hypothetical protein
MIFRKNHKHVGIPPEEAARYELIGRKCSYRFCSDKSHLREVWAPYRKKRVVPGADMVKRLYSEVIRRIRTLVFNLCFRRVDAPICDCPHCGRTFSCCNSAKVVTK